MFLGSSQLVERLIQLDKLDGSYKDVATTNESHKKPIKAQYDKLIFPRSFFEGELVFLYYQTIDSLGEGKFISMWHGPYIVK